MKTPLQAGFCLGLIVALLATAYPLLHAQMPVRHVPNTMRSSATNLMIIRPHAYDVGAYGPSYNPVQRHGAFAVADWTPCVLDNGTGFYGNVWDRTVDYRQVGFSHSTYRSAWSGSSYTEQQFWNSAPWSAKAALAYLDGPFFNTGQSTPPRYHLDPAGAIGTQKTPNFFQGLRQWPQMKARIDNTMVADIESHSLYAYDYEASDYMPDTAGATRNSLDGGKYRHESQGGTDVEWKTKGDGEYWYAMTDAGAQYWQQFDAYIKSKRRPGGQFFQYSNGCGGIMGGGRPSGYGGREHEMQTTNNGTGIPLWWYTWTSKFWQSEHKDFSSAVDQYYNQTTARGSRALTDLMWTYEIQHRGMINEVGIRGGAPKPSLVFIAPFMERNPRQGWRQEHEPAPEQVARGMAIIPWFYKGGGWLWGTEAHPTWGQEINGINGVNAKGEGTDHYIAGRKMISQLADFKKPDTEVVCVELSFDGGNTYVGDSDNFMEGTRALNSSKYNAYFIHDRTKDGVNAGRGWPLVLGLRAANGRIAIAASRVGGTEQDSVSFKARIRRQDGSYWRSDMTLYDREWVVGSDSTTIKVNFQPAITTPPSGYLVDSGAVFGDRGNGYSYGWNAANNETRNRTEPSPDVRYATLNHMQKPSNPNASWSIALPNGNYSVRIVAGDALNYGDTFKIAAQGMVVVSGIPTSESRWLEGTRELYVGDGRLVIRNSSGSVNNKICFLEITPVSTPSVSLSTVVSQTQERSGVPASFRITRNGTTTSPLVVNIIPGGNAMSGLDYAALESIYTIPAGSTFLDVPVVSLPDTIIEGDEIVSVQLGSSTGYVAGAQSSASMIIRDSVYDEWRKNSFLSTEWNNPQITGDLADPDADGISNQLEYALGLNPKTAQKTTVQQRILGNRLEMKATRAANANDVQFIFEVSADLAVWKSGSAEVDVTTVNNADGSVSYTGLDRNLLTGTMRRFIRLRVLR